MKSSAKLLLAASVLLASSCNFEGGFYMDDLDAFGPASFSGFEPAPSGDRFDEIVENKFIKAAEEPKSTFSTDADGASYAYMRKSVRQNKVLPPPNAVRIEEFLNYFTFDYDEPAPGKSLSINAETSACPWESSHKILRLGLKGKTIPESEWPTANYVFLIDVSGSMDSEDKLPLLKKGIVSMLDYMRDDDQIAIVTYSGTAETLLKPTKAKNARQIKKAVNKLNAWGCTNGGDALRDAYKLAEEAYITGGNNRVIMGTDGDFNVGVTSTEQILEIVQSYAEKGIYMTVCGFGTGNLNDSMMETVSNKGNGTYEYIDCEEEMVKVFVRERNRFVAVANDTKVQVTFDPEYVDSYRLIGYENRVMSNEDFENDKKDAGEIGSGQTVTALYEIIPTEKWGNGTCGTFDARYKEALGEESISLSTVIRMSSGEQLSKNMSLASGIAAFGLWLRDSEYRGSASPALAKELVQAASGQDDESPEAQLVKLIGKAEEIKR